MCLEWGADGESLEGTRVVRFQHAWVGGARWAPRETALGAHAAPEALRAALRSIEDDHKQACMQLAEAVSSGQTGLVEVLRARGAVVA